MCKVLHLIFFQLLTLLPMVPTATRPGSMSTALITTGPSLATLPISPHSHSGPMGYSDHSSLPPLPHIDGPPNSVVPPCTFHHTFFVVHFSSHQIQPKIIPAHIASLAPCKHEVPPMRRPPPPFPTQTVVAVVFSHFLHRASFI